ncbi:MAG: hypothetical protein R3B93_03820 [Bacteroidia bacterium]
MIITGFLVTGIQFNPAIRTNKSSRAITISVYTGPTILAGNIFTGVFGTNKTQKKAEYQIFMHAQIIITPGNLLTETH